VGVRREQVRLHTDTARHGQAGGAATQLLHRQGDRRQAPAARCVQRQRRAGEVKQIRDPGSHGRRHRAEDLLRVGLVRQPLVAGVGGAEDDGGPGAAQIARRPPRTLDRLVHELQREALRGIHQLRLAERDTEESVVEQVDAVQIAQPDVGGARAAAGLPDPLGAGLTYAVAAEAQVVMPRLEIGGAGKQARRPDDGHVVAVHIDTSLNG
jgi:hypothetical protein